MNKIMLIGNVCADPEVRAIPDGTKVANFSLATNESYKTKEGKQVDKTEFHRLVFWRKLADICELYVKKGKQIYVEGKITTRKYEKDGVNHYMTEIICTEIVLLGSAKDKPEIVESDSNSYSTPENAYPKINTESDNLPF